MPITKNQLVAALERVTAAVSPEAVAALETHVEDMFSDKKDILQYRDQYPKPKTNVLYRAVFLDEATYSGFLKQGTLRPSNKYIESWSSSKEAMEDYAEERADSLDQFWGKQHILYLKKSVPPDDIVADVVQVSGQFKDKEMVRIAQAEQEVITTPQTVTKTNVYRQEVWDGSED